MNDEGTISLAEITGNAISTAAMPGQALLGGRGADGKEGGGGGGGGYYGGGGEAQRELILQVVRCFLLALTRS